MSRIKSLAGVVLLVGALAACTTGSEPDRPEADSPVDQASSSGASGEDLSLRVELYETVDELTRKSTIVVAGYRLDTAPSVLKGYGDRITPFADVPFVVEEVAKGDVKPGELVHVAFEGSLADDGSITSEGLEMGPSYLLFLVPMGEKAPNAFAVTGYLAGIYKSDGQGAYDRTDPESPGLPESLTLAEVMSLVEAGK